MRKRRPDLRTSRKSLPVRSSNQSPDGYHLRSDRYSNVEPASPTVEKGRKPLGRPRGARTRHSENPPQPSPVEKAADIDFLTRINTVESSISSSRPSRSGRRVACDSESYIKKKFLYNATETPRRPRGRRSSNVGRPAISRNATRGRYAVQSSSTGSSVRGNSRKTPRRTRGETHVNDGTMLFNPRKRRRSMKTEEYSPGLDELQHWDQDVHNGAEVFPLPGLTYEDKHPDFDFKPQDLSQIYPGTSGLVSDQPELEHPRNSLQELADTIAEGVLNRHDSQLMDYKRYRPPMVADYLLHSPPLTPPLPAPIHHHPQVSSEDMEDEDLLAPQLSVLTGAAMLPNANGSLVSENGSASISAMSVGLPSNSCGSSGGSRRKSPVRPMQVVRTKASHYPVVSTSPTSLLSDTSPADHYHEPGLATQLNETTIFCLPAMESKSSGIRSSPAIRSYQHYTSSHHDSNESAGLLPALLGHHPNQSSGLVRSLPSKPITSSAPVTSTVSLSSQHQSQSIASRKRPAILKRTLLNSIPASGSISTENPISSVPHSFYSNRMGFLTDMPPAMSAATSITINSPVPSLATHPRMATAPVASRGEHANNQVLLHQLNTTLPAGLQQQSIGVTASDMLFRRGRPFTSTQSQSFAAPARGAISLLSSTKSIVEGYEPSTSSASTVRCTVLREMPAAKRFVLVNNSTASEQKSNMQPTTINANPHPSLPSLYSTLTLPLSSPVPPTGSNKLLVSSSEQQSRLPTSSTGSLVANSSAAQVGST